MGNIYAYYALPHHIIYRSRQGRDYTETIVLFTRFPMKCNLKPDTVIMVTPHGPVFQDAVAIMRDMEIGGSMRRFRAPQVRFKNKIDMDLTDEILDMAQKMGIPTVEITKSSEKKYGVSCELDHGSMVPMYFINQKYSDYQLVHITYGLLSPEQLYQFGICVKKAVEQIQRSVVFIASGDLSHRLIKEGPYEFSPYGEKFDSEIRSLLEQGDVHGVLNMDTTMVREAGSVHFVLYTLGALDS